MPLQYEPDALTNIPKEAGIQVGQWPLLYLAPNFMVGESSGLMIK